MIFYYEQDDPRLDFPYQVVDESKLREDSSPRKIKRMAKKEWLKVAHSLTLRKSEHSLNAYTNGLVFSTSG